jgi:hypothetical protein
MTLGRRVAMMGFTCGSLPAGSSGVVWGRGQRIYCRAEKHGTMENSTLFGQTIQPAFNRVKDIRHSIVTFGTLAIGNHARLGVIPAN